MTIFTKNSILTFGKYKGASIQDILDDEPTYIEWAIDEIEWFQVDEEVQNILDSMLSSQNEDDFGWWLDADGQEDMFPSNNWNDFD